MWSNEKSKRCNLNHPRPRIQKGREAELSLVTLTGSWHFTRLKLHKVPGILLHSTSHNLPQSYVRKFKVVETFLRFETSQTLYSTKMGNPCQIVSWGKLLGTVQ